MWYLHDKLPLFPLWQIDMWRMDRIPFLSLTLKVIATDNSDILDRGSKVSKKLLGSILSRFSLGTKSSGTIFSTTILDGAILSGIILTYTRWNVARTRGSVAFSVLLNVPRRSLTPDTTPSTALPAGFWHQHGRRPVQAIYRYVACAYLIAHRFMMSTLPTGTKKKTYYGACTLISFFFLTLLHADSFLILVRPKIALKWYHSRVAAETPLIIPRDLRFQVNFDISDFCTRNEFYENRVKPASSPKTHFPGRRKPTESL